MELVPDTTYPAILDEPPSPPASLTHYDLIHGLLFARLLSAASDGRDWREGARCILLRDVDADPEGARRCWDTHLARARWLVTTGITLAGRGAQPTGDDPSDYPMVPVRDDLLVTYPDPARRN